MDALGGYSSSEPEDCGEAEVGEVGEESTPKAPIVTPPKERYALVHVCIPVCDRGITAFAQKMMGLARLALVNYPVKASFVKHDRPYHISLSKPFKVPVSQTPAIFSALRAALRNSNSNSGTVHLRQKPIGLLSKNSRRLFVASPIYPVDVVVGLIGVVDAAFKTLGLPTFYEDPKPHMSFASTETTDVQDAFNNIAEPHKEESTFAVEVSAVSCEIGQQQIVIPLEKV